MLSVRDVHFHYQDEPVLKGISLDIDQYSVSGLVGGNGCGKSTLFMNLTGVLRPRQGLSGGRGRRWVTARPICWPISILRSERGFRFMISTT